MKRRREEDDATVGAMDVLEQCAGHDSRPDTKLTALRGVLVGAMRRATAGDVRTPLWSAMRASAARPVVREHVAAKAHDAYMLAGILRLVGQGPGLPSCQLSGPLTVL